MNSLKHEKTVKERFGIQARGPGHSPGLPNGESGPAYMPSGIRPEVRLTPDQKMYYGYLRQSSYVVLHRSKIPLVLTTKVTDLRGLLFRQQDGVNSVVRRIYLAYFSNHR